MGDFYTLAKAIPCPACGFKVVFENDGKQQVVKQTAKEIVEICEGMKNQAQSDIEKCNTSNPTSFAEDGGDELAGKIDALSDIQSAIKSKYQLEEE